MAGSTVKRWAGAVLVALFALTLPLAAHAQNGQVTGTVTDQETGGPLGTVQVFLQGTSRGGLSTAQGTFTLTDVPPGTYTIVAQRIGYQNATQEDVVVAAGATASVELSMAPTALQLQEIVATGLIDPVEGVRSPISVARVSRDVMPVVAAGNALQNLQGRVAGATINRGSGQPGEDVSIMLRSPTSLRGTGAPLIVVDGVILGGVGGGGATGVEGNTTAIEGMDIENVEIIRGAAAASLYGSRAAAGVISITTRRGQELPTGETRFSARSEYGITEAVTIDDLPSHHHFLMNESQTAFVDRDGNVVTSAADRVPDGANNLLHFMDKPYPGPVYDNISSVLKPGAYQSHNVTVSQNTASTNFAASLSRTAEQGALEGNDGYHRNSFRLNLDHRFQEALSLGVSMAHIRDGRENIAIGNDATLNAFEGQALFTQMLQAPRDVDFSAKDEDGNFVRNFAGVDFENPLWAQSTRESDTQGNRTLLNSTLAWSPSTWLSASGDVSYDRREQMTRNYIPKGTAGQAENRDGSLAFNGQSTDTWNASGQVSLRQNFGSHDARVTFRGLMERDRTELGNRTGYNFTVGGVPQLSNVPPEFQRSTSAEREVRAIGYLVDTGIGLFDGKYNFTLLGRRDGSSLFGEDARWRNYYRVAGAWRMAEEPWFNIPGIDEFKLSVARGTAGGRPAWDAQYETWELTQGLPTKDQLGNGDLRPEHTTENEVSLNAIVQNRYGIDLTHSWQTTRDQIVPAPLPGYIGYTSQWVNSGVISGRTTELTIEAQLIQRPNFAWTSNLIADYSTATIEEWTLPCDASRTWRFDCQGEPVYGIYGFRLLNNANQLANHRGGEAVPFDDQFQVNDEGYLVWVGDKDYTDGMVDGVVQEGTWGTSSPVLGGRTYEWGIPFFEEDEAGATKRPSLGEGSPVNLGWTNNVRYGNFNFHAQFHAAIGGVANNRAFQDMINTSGNFPRMDQSGKPDGLKKPVGYYRGAVGSGGSTYITENADYFKLRTLSVNYRFGQQQLQRFGLRGLGMENVQIGVTGRNIFTITGFEGWDPEQALNLNNRLNSVGTGTYPSTRTWTAEVSLTF